MRTNQIKPRFFGEIGRPNRNPLHEMQISPHTDEGQLKRIPIEECCSGRFLRFRFQLNKNTNVECEQKCREEKTQAEDGRVPTQLKEHDPVEDRTTSGE